MAQANGSTHSYIVPKTEAIHRQTGAGNDETILSNGYDTVFYDPAGSRTGVILEAGIEDGQKVFVVNVADGAETITFAAAATSNVANGTSAVVARNECMPLVWDTVTELWYGAPAA